MKRVLLHVCCAPCSTAVIESLQLTAEVTAFFYNPNIHPVSEYVFRAKEMQDYGAHVGVIVKEGAYDIRSWFQMIDGVEWVAEKSRLRCERCIRLRLERTAFEARAEGFSAFTTTLSISPHKDPEQINRIGREVGASVGVHFLEADFKQSSGFERSIDLSRQQKLYRQNYCGCVFSRLERKRYAKIAS